MNFLHKGDKKKDEEEHEGQIEGAGEIIDEKKKKSKKKEEADVAIQMASGDYLIHIYIEEAKQLDIDTDRRAEVLVGVNVTGFEIPVSFSTTKENVHRDSVLDWNEHIFIQSGSQPKEKV